MKQFTKYIALYGAALAGDWEAAKQILDSDPAAMFANISSCSEPILHIAALAGHPGFIEELVKLMPVDALAHQTPHGNTPGNTALSYAVTASNNKGAMAMVRKNPKLTQMYNSWEVAPIHQAALLGNKELVCFLLKETKDEDPSPFRGHAGVNLLRTVITAGFYDVALELVQKYPELATKRNKQEESALDVLSQKASAFPSGSRMGFWQRIIYSWIHVEETSTDSRTKGDTEDPPQRSLDRRTQALQRWNQFFWKFIEQLVPSIKQAHDAKLMHIQACELAKCICNNVVNLDNHPMIGSLFINPLLNAARLGIVEFVVISLQAYPELIMFHRRYYTILHAAIEHRQEKVFNLIRGMGGFKNSLATFGDTDTNVIILHLAAKLAPYHKLNSVTGGALQMQRELQWYKAVEDITQPTYRIKQNKDKKIPPVLFSEEHENLVKEGEKWMKDMASSCMIVATLITTVMFAAAFTVPGGNDQEKGIPIFLKANAFMIFVVSDALGLFCSSTSVLIFLSILTSRYAEEDFLISLPKKLIIGLSTLFLSIANMMVAFSATFFIMLDHHLAWVAILIALLATVPVTLFAILQFPLLVEIVLSTYWSDIFHQQSKSVAYLFLSNNVH